MKKLVALALGLALLAGCGPKASLPEGAPSPIKTKRLQEHIAENELKFEKLRLSGKGTYEDENTRQSFRFDIRLLKDSLVWINLSDPILGISLARGIVKPNQVSYYNSLQKNYFTGTPEKLQKRFAFTFQFQTLFPLLSANLMNVERELNLDFIPAAYKLMDYDPSGESPPDPTQESFHEFQVSPDNYRPLEQLIRQPIYGKVLTAAYEAYGEKEPVFPEKIILNYAHNGRTKIVLNISSVEVDRNFGFPFKIPAQYEPLP